MEARLLLLQAVLRTRPLAKQLVTTPRRAAAGALACAEPCLAAIAHRCCGGGAWRVRVLEVRRWRGLEYVLGVSQQLVHAPARLLLPNGLPHWWCLRRRVLELLGERVLTRTSDTARCSEALWISSLLGAPRRRAVLSAPIRARGSPIVSPQGFVCERVPVEVG